MKRKLFYLIGLVFLSMVVCFSPLYADDDDEGEGVTISSEPSLEVDTADGSETLTYDDVYDDDGNYIYDYTGSGDKAEMDDYINDFFGGGISRGSSYLSRVMDAQRALDAAIAAGLDLNTIHELEDKLEQCKEDLENYCSEHGYTYSINADSTFGAIYDAGGKTVTHAGDPVILATGDFIIDDVDFSLRGKKSSFCLTRHYSSLMAQNEINSGIFGKGWTSNIETRIIRGWSADYEKEIPAWESYLEELYSYESEIAGYAAEDSECAEMHNEIQAIIMNAQMNIAAFTEAARISEFNREKNRFVDYGVASEFARKVGNDTVFFVQDNGGFIPFKKIGEGLYENASPFAFPSIMLREEDGKFFIEFPKTGEKRIYSEYGLPLLFSFSDGGKIEFIYDENSRIIKIVIDENNAAVFSWKDGRLYELRDEKSPKSFFYEFESNNLACVSDSSNDKKRFVYNRDGILAEQVRSDGSVVSFDYEMIDGKFRAVKTTNEEGKSEHFSYDFKNRSVVYTDHDGVKSFFVYDELGRTVREKYADGSEKNITYGENGLVSSVNLNGFLTRFFYDDKNNLIQKLYPDSSLDKWAFDDNNNLISFTDRDGITRTYFYNENSKLTDVYLGNQSCGHLDYDDEGCLSQSVDCRGNKVLYGYDKNKNLSERIFYSAEGKREKTEGWQYDDFGRISAYTDGLNRKTKISYDDHSVTFSCPNGLEVREEYSGRKLLLRRIMRDTVTGEERVYSYSYNKEKLCTGLSVSGIDSAGHRISERKVTSYSYTDAGKLASLLEIEPFYGKSHDFLTNFSYDSAGKLFSSESGFSDKSDRRAGFLNAPKKSVYSYVKNQFGYVNMVQKFDGKIISSQSDFDGRLCSVSENGVKLSDLEYSRAGRMLRSKDFNSGFIEYKYNSETGIYEGMRENGGTLSSFSKSEFYPDTMIKVSYDRNGKKSQYFYDSTKKLIKILSDGKASEIDYDALGRMTSFILRDTKSNIVFETSFSYDGRKILCLSGGKYKRTYITNAFSEIIAEIDAYGNKTFYERDLLGRLVFVKNPYGYVKKISYNARNQIVRIDYPDASFATYEYDEFSNCVSMSINGETVWKAVYDSSGRIKKYGEAPFRFESEYYYDDYGNLSAIRANEVFLFRNEFSDDGKKVTRIDAKGNKNFFTYDGFSRLLSWENSLSDTSSLFYNEDGSINEQRDFNSNRKHFAYSDSHFYATNPDGETFSYEYDSLGRLILAENKNSLIQFSYDTSGRILSQNEGKKLNEISYAYDLNGNLSKLSSNERTISYLRGKSGEVLEITDTLTLGSSFQKSVVTFVYDSCGREILRIYDSGASMKTVYDKQGRVILKAAFSKFLEPFFVDGKIYSKKGELVYSLDSDFTVTKYSYDDFGRVSSVSYPYSEKRNRKMKKEIGSAGLFYHSENPVFPQLSFSESDYNSLQKLCSLVGLGSKQIPVNQSVLVEDFDYDLNGNVIKKTNPYGSIKYFYDSENRLISWGNGCSASYDKNGNMTFKKDAYSELSCDFNFEDRMTGIKGKNFLENESFSRKFSYDALSRRLQTWKSESGGEKNSYLGEGLFIFSVTKVFDSDYSLSNISESNRTSGNTGSHSERYLFIADGNEQTGLPDTKRGLYSESKNIYPLYDDAGCLLSSFSAQNYYIEEPCLLFTNSQGTVMAERNSSGLVEDYSYDIFGTPDSSCPKFSFIGKQYDLQSYMYDFGFRDYEPSKFRFTSSDPIHDGLNWYSYCSSNPAEYFDRNGLYGEKPEIQYMQDMEHTLLGNSPNEYADKEGCVVTCVAMSFSSITGICIDNSYINNNSSCFGTYYNEKTGYDERGNIDWNGVLNEFSLKHEVLFTAEVPTNLIRDAEELYNAVFFSTPNEYAVAEKNTSQNGIKNSALTPNADYEKIADSYMTSKNIQEIRVEQTLTKIQNSPTRSFVMAQIEYQTCLYHFAGIGTEIVNINGAKMVEVYATSLYDSAARLGNNRQSVGWIEKDGKVYAPVTAINRIDTISKSN